MIKLYIIRWLYIAVLAVAAVGVPGCEETASRSTTPKELERDINLDTTIGELTESYQFGAVEVRGFGIVAGLAGTGSSECPADLRNELVKYIRTKSEINPQAFINSPDTAVVDIYGVMPAVTSRGEYFDLKIKALTSSQTTSLDGGNLFTTNLRAASRLLTIDAYSLFSKKLATAHGPVFINKLGTAAADKTEGYVLGGGVVANDVLISLILLEPNYLIANAIHNRLNERFEPRTAKAVSPGEVQLTIPARFRRRKAKFLAMVRELYLAENESLKQRRIDSLVAGLANDEEKYASEVALCAIGKQAVDKLAPLLGAKDEKVRFHAGRCMLDIGDDRGLRVLGRIAGQMGSAYRIDAIRAIGSGARRNDAISILNRVLGDEDFEVKFAAYEQLRKLEDISISQILVDGEFLVDSVIQSGPKVIFVSRRDVPRIVLFGSPIYCEKNIFVESPDGRVTINALPGGRSISVMRKHPTRPGPVGPMNCSLELRNVIRTLGESMKKPNLRPGLDVSYSDLIALLEQMCESGAVKADFIPGLMPILSTNLEKMTLSDR